MSASGNKNLIILRAGDKSLHTSWYSGKSRNWDLVLSYYGEKQSPFLGYYDFLHEFRGSKWQGINDFVINNIDLVGSYEQVWLPDDDIMIDGDSINRFFDLNIECGFDLSQPSLKIFSYVSHSITIRRPSHLARETNFVEIMAPCFSARALNLLSNSFAENTSGWGLEWLWASRLKNAKCKIGIVDDVAMYHSRPVGSAGHGGGVSPKKEMQNLLSDYGIDRVKPAVLRSIVKNNGFMSNIPASVLRSINKAIVKIADN